MMTEEHKRKMMIKRIFIIIFLLLLATPCFAVELLIQAKDHWLDNRSLAEIQDKTNFDTYQARTQKGDIIVVRPDGWKWGKEERLPNYIVVKIPDMTMKEAKKLEESLSGANGKLLRKRKYAIPRDEVDAAVLGKLDKIQIRKNAFNLMRKVKVGDKNEYIRPKTDLLSYLEYKTRSFRNMFPKPAYAATQLKKTVKPSGGDYTSLEACMSANEQDLVANGYYFDVEIDGNWTSADTTRVSIDTYTTDATHYINIYTTATARHSGKWDTNAYILQYNSSYGQLAIYVPYVTIDGLQVRDSSSSSGEKTVRENISSGSGEITIKNCIIKGSGASNNGRAIYIEGNASSLTVYIYNNIVIGEGTGGDRGIRLGGGASYIHRVYNNTVVNFSTGIVRNYGTAYVTNNYVSATTCYSGTMTKTTTASSDTTGSTGLQNIAYSTTSGTYFTNVTSGSEDLHITSTSSSLYNAGTDLSAYFTDDIDGDTRSGTWDIGADEYVSSGGATRRIMLIQ